MNVEKTCRSIAVLDQKLWHILYWSDGVISVQYSKMKLKIVYQICRFAKKVQNFHKKIGIQLKFGI